MGTADRACTAAFVAVTLLGASSAEAQANGTRSGDATDERAMVVAIDWRRGAGAEGCIDAPMLEREVEGRLERRVFGNAMEADVFLHGQIERRESDFVVRLSMVAANGRVLGERELRSDSPDCARLDESLAV